MKRVLLCIGIVFGLGCIAIGGFFYIQETTYDLLGKVQFVNEAFDNEDYALASKIADEAKDAWNVFAKKSVYITDQDHALEIGSCFARISVLAKQENDELKIECAVAENLVRSFFNEQKPTLSNIL